MSSDRETTVQELRDVMQRFVDEREWRQFHDPKNLAMSIAIEAAELMEHFQWSRSDQLDELTADDARKAEIAEELADVLAYTLSLANTLEIDITRTLLGKMEKNAVKYPADKFRGRSR